MSSVRRADVLWRSTMDAVLIRPPGASELTKLAGTGRTLWTVLEEPASFDELVARLATAYDAEVDVVAADVAPVIDDLVERGSWSASMSDQAAPTEAWLRALAGHGLTGSETLGSAPALDELLARAARHRLVGVLAAAVEEGAVDVDREGRDRIVAAHEDAMREVLLLEDELLRAVGVLDEAGVESRVLKGAALAHMVHPDPSERCFGDNDLLVPAADVDRAVAALIAAGAERPSPPLSHSFDRRFAKSVTLAWHGGTELDLHRTLAAGPYGLLIRLADLFIDPVEVILAGRALQTLPAHLHLVHGAIHVALGDVEARLGNVRDLALLAARPSVDVDLVVETARRWGCEAPVARGLRETAALGHRRTDVERWADDHTPDRVDRGRLAAYDRRDGRYRRQAVASWSVLGWRDRVAFSLALLRPRRG